jgi:type IV pilus assembly protein PilA
MLSRSRGAVVGTATLVVAGFGPGLKESTVKKIQKNEGFTLIELLIVVAIIGIIAAIAVPGLLRARMSGNEASAIGSLRAINTAQQNYSQLCNGYSPTLAGLAYSPGAAGNPYLSPDMTIDPVQKSGYETSVADEGVAVTIGACAADGEVVTTTYFAASSPLTFASTGTRHFGTNAAATIYQNTANVPFAASADLAVAGTVTVIQ